MGNPQSLETGTAADYPVVIFILIPGVRLQNDICSSTRWSGGDQIRARPKLIQATEEKSLKPPEGVRTIAMIPLLSAFFYQMTPPGQSNGIHRPRLDKHATLAVCCRGERACEEDQGCCGTRREKVGRLFKEPRQTLCKVSKHAVSCASCIEAHNLARLPSFSPHVCALLKQHGPCLYLDGRCDVAIEAIAFELSYGKM